VNHVKTAALMALTAWTLLHLGCWVASLDELRVRATVFDVDPWAYVVATGCLGWTWAAVAGVLVAVIVWPTRKDS
jgi:hypothetical protein